MYVAVLLVCLVVVVITVAWVCDRRGWPTPLGLVLVGAAVAAVPGVPAVGLNPDLVLIGLLPPLLYAAAAQVSLFDFTRNLPTILLLSVGAVVFSTIAVGLATVAVLPSAGLAAAFALGAVVAPPDAVAASAVGRRIGMPRRITSLLENESLVNDATALALLTTAVLALSRPVTVGEVAWRFALAAGGGLVVGLLATVLLGAVRRQLTDPLLSTSLSFLAPFIAYLPAEAIGASGVLSVVITGLGLASTSAVQQSAASRVVERTTWRTVAFLLENAVFLIIGLQLPGLVDRISASGRSWPQVLAVCLAVFAATVLARGVFVAATGAVRSAVPRLRQHSEATWRGAVVLSWAGMRGVVTLAAAFVLPPETPQLDLLRLAAFTVVAGTLLVQGLTLPGLVRSLGLRGPDPAEDALQAAVVVDAAARAGLRRLDELLTGDEPGDVVRALRQRSAVRSNSVWERLGRAESDQATPSETYRRLRVSMLAVERDHISGLRRGGTYDEQVLRAALIAVDLEESLLDKSQDRAAGTARQDDLVPRAAGECDHLSAAPRVVRLKAPGACADCEREGTTWVHLRGCLTCGAVSCCDSSPARHADRHYQRTGHPVMRSPEPGEAWRWCYVDARTG